MTTELNIGDWVQVVGPCDRASEEHQYDARMFRIGFIGLCDTVFGEDDTGSPVYPATSLRKLAMSETDSVHIKISAPMDCADLAAGMEKCLDAEFHKSSIDTRLDALETSLQAVVNRQGEQKWQIEKMSKQVDMAQTIRDAIDCINQQPISVIADTIWFSKTQTLVEHLQRALVE